MLETGSTTPLLSSRTESYVDYQTIISDQRLTAGDDLRSTDCQPEKWNEPRTNVWRILATFYSFIVVGANDGAYGLGKYYDADYTTVSLVFLSPFMGYAIAALGNNWIHDRFGQRGIALIGAGLHIISYLATTTHPPYPVLIAVFIISGLGNGIVDASWNAWIGAMHNSSQLMGILHAFYGLGAALAPLTATYLITDRGWKWYEFYYAMAIAAGIEFLTSVAAFWSSTGSGSKDPDACTDGTLSSDSSANLASSAPPRKPTLESLRMPSTWVISLFLFVYVGAEVTIGGWVFTFLVDLRNMPLSTAGFVSFSYWGGLTVGRVCLGFLTPYFNNQRLAVLLYLGCCIFLHLTFCVVDDLRLLVVSVTLLGFFLGPLYPEAVIAQAKLLPKSLHVAAVGFACALGSAGGYGIKVLQPIVLAMLVLCLVLWLVLPEKHEDGRRQASPA
ncbi:putative MFS transporter [Aspergillus novofumigatus IBT 16806]|uniref:Putative MFS transporter n=1 Tax=Aspergillus novofumigatus (strain IBT 16806) TaxID=1392255 RepID=A0A2I1CFB3_ASPN1|nr:putative MFS transporter [Aspergillus novofumigatus IBT 16806]PKX96312.1 putative MFS transporter [Aspergillus novofumigatus IBT 16806]